MKTLRLIEPLIYLVFILAALAILALTVLAPAEWSDVAAVYQGF